MEFKSGYWREDDLRSSFNALTKQVFCFDFIKWYEAGFWTDAYNPHSILDGARVVANVSVNQMQFAVCGTLKRYLQLGTVMTDPEYRGRGFNRRVMEEVLGEENEQTDGIYLFGNDSVLDFYPKFGFVPVDEVQYSRSVKKCDKAEHKELVVAETKEEIEHFLSIIKQHEEAFPTDDPNDGFAMRNCSGLYAFWLQAEYHHAVWYLPEQEAYCIAEQEGTKLRLLQVICDKPFDYDACCAAFGSDIETIELAFTPRYKEEWTKNAYKCEDCTLFIRGSQIKKDITGDMHFPELSHA